MASSMTAMDHMKTLYNAFCENANEDYVLTRLHSILLHRGLRYDTDGLAELTYYVDCFGYSAYPSDPAFCYEIKRLIEFMGVSIE